MVNSPDNAFQYDGVDGKYPAWLKKAGGQLYSTHCDISGPDGVSVRVEVGEWVSQDKDGNVKVSGKAPHHKAPEKDTAEEEAAPVDTTGPDGEVIGEVLPVPVEEAPA